MGMVGVNDGFRWAISNGRSAFPQQSLLLSLGTILVLLASGIWYFRKPNGHSGRDLSGAQTCSVRGLRELPVPHLARRLLKRAL